MQWSVVKGKRIGDSFTNHDFMTVTLKIHIHSDVRPYFSCVVYMLGKNTNLPSPLEQRRVLPQFKLTMVRYVRIP